MRNVRRDVVLCAITLIVAIAPLGAAQAQETQFALEEVLIPWDQLATCDFLRRRTIKNRIRISNGLTTSIVAGRMLLADGEVRGGPYDAMGLETYVEIRPTGLDDPPARICGIAFSTGSFEITPEGFKLHLGTIFRMSQVSPAKITAKGRASTSGPPEAVPSATADIIESRIDGEFRGWDGSTKFKLQNGQIWQQTSYAYMIKFADSPKVTVYRSGSGYRMKVEGMDGEISVKRLQ